MLFSLWQKAAQASILPLKFRENSIRRAHLFTLQQVATLVELHEIVHDIRADNRLAPNPQDGDFPPAHQTPECVAPDARILCGLVYRQADPARAGRRVSQSIAPGRAVIIFVIVMPPVFEKRKQPRQKVGAVITYGTLRRGCPYSISTIPPYLPRAPGDAP